jgi:hypothetical protein
MLWQSTWKWHATSFLTIIVAIHIIHQYQGLTIDYFAFGSIGKHHCELTYITFSCIKKEINIHTIDTNEF